MSKILIVDDEEFNIEILEETLKRESAELIITTNGKEALDALEKNYKDIYLIILDVMMPVMDGYEFMENLKQHKNFKDIPVIMQTAAASRVEIAKGIEAGAYYYLTKPYESDIMTLIARAAISNHLKKKELKDEIKKLSKINELTSAANYSIKNLTEARNIASLISTFYPDSHKVCLGILELLINAIEHGNLGISYARKTELLKQSSWLEEVNRLLEDPKHRDKRVTIDFTRADSEIILKITDEGDGFTWKEYMEIGSDRATHFHGRGIALSNTMSFDEVIYEGTGNTVICITKISDEAEDSRKVS